MQKANNPAPARDICKVGRHAGRFRGSNQAAIRIWGKNNETAPPPPPPPCALHAILHVCVCVFLGVLKRCVSLSLPRPPALPFAERKPLSPLENKTLRRKERAAPLLRFEPARAGCERFWIRCAPRGCAFNFYFGTIDRLAQRMQLFFFISSEDKLEISLRVHTVDRRMKNIAQVQVDIYTGAFPSPAVLSATLSCPVCLAVFCLSTTGGSIPPLLAPTFRRAHRARAERLGSTRHADMLYTDDDNAVRRRRPP